MTSTDYRSRPRGPVVSNRYWLVDDRKHCVVPGCMVRSRVLVDGVCPPQIRDERHDRYLAELRGKR